MKRAEEVLHNQLRPTSNGHVQMKPLILHQTDTVSTRMENTRHPMSTSYALFVYSCNTSDILRSVEKANTRQEYLVDGSPPFVGMTRVYTDKPASSLN